MAEKEEKGERLQKYLARCGLGSRRKCEEYISEGRVSINTITQHLGARVRKGDKVELDGKHVSPLKPEYYLVNKPTGFICSTRSEGGRKRVIDIIPGAAERGLFTVGRLDVDTSGIIVVTNDGEFANNLIHPSKDVEKEYVVVVEGSFGEMEACRIRDGIDIGEARLAKALVESFTPKGKNTRIRLLIHEGRFRVVRRIMAALEMRVISLQRTRLGPFNLEDIPLGAYRPISCFPDSLSETCSQ